MISVIIPTIWQCNHFLVKTLENINDCKSVNEIIIIDNNPELSIQNKNLNHHKVKILKQEKNLFFNKSANLGVDESKSKFCCVLNDDVIIKKDILEFCIFKQKPKHGCYFISPRNIINNQGARLHSLLKTGLKGKQAKTPTLSPYKDTIYHGPGMLMFFNKHNYKHIPTELIHWYGDIFIKRYMEHNNLENFLIEGIDIKTEGSSGSMSASFAAKEVKKDSTKFKRIFKKYFN